MNRGKCKLLKRLSAIALTGIMTIGMSTAAFAEGEIRNVETVDSASLGVNIGLYDYDKAANLGGGYLGGDGKIQQGLLNNLLGSDGYPVSKVTGLSLKEYFSKDGTSVKKSYENCNNLFLKSAYDADKTLYYSSFDNYAFINDNSQFGVYDKLGTPKNNKDFFYKRGNFLPFNNLTEGNFSVNTNLYDKNGKELSKDAARYNEPLYLVENPNYYFGMYMSTGFKMTKDLKYNDKDMIFEFNGDDDLWIFIDDVLVLDIGGIHDAHTGSINFTTGEIIEDTSSQNVERTNKTTLRKRFIEANNGADDDTIKAIFGDTDTFLGKSGHVLKMFYMERGQGASNCLLKFNLPTVAEDKIDNIVIEEPTGGKGYAEITDEPSPLDDSPKTADTSQIAVSLVILVSSLSVMSFVAVRRIKRTM